MFFSPLRCLRTGSSSPAPQSVHTYHWLPQPSLVLTMKEITRNLTIGMVLEVDGRQIPQRGNPRSRNVHSKDSSVQTRYKYATTYKILLMIEILHDLVYPNPGNDGSVLHVRSCRMCIINSSTQGSSKQGKASRHGPEKFSQIHVQGPERPDKYKAPTNQSLLY